MVVRSSHLSRTGRNAIKTYQTVEIILFVKRFKNEIIFINSIVLISVNIIIYLTVIRQVPIGKLI